MHRVQSIEEARTQLSVKGFVVLRGFFSASETRALRELSDEMSSEAQCILRSSCGAGTPLSERARTNKTELIVVAERHDPERVCRYEYMLGWCSTFKSWVQASISEVVSEAAGCDMTVFKDKTNEKSPGGGGFGPHQDFAAYMHFQPRSHLTAMLSVDSATRENGCLEFAANFNRVVSEDPLAVLEYVQSQPLLKFKADDACHGDILDEISQSFAWTPVESKAADLVLFDSFAPHRSACNRSRYPRRASFVTFVPGIGDEEYERYYAEKRANYDDPKFHVSTPTSYRS
jgi:ectoine hydroxylase-related dioxygenase (phytanoyl-CoA dioxygenase family)